VALGCYDALSEKGLSCPDDMSVTGYNDAPFMDLVQPPLTTIRIKQRDMGTVAARVLLARMAGEDAGADILLRPELIKRKSTAPLRK
jgi:LacI family transcriptional regulator